MSDNPADKYVIDKLFPIKEIHLIFGPSGSGKTTLALQTLRDWAAAKSVLGYASYPKPFCYISCARSNDELESHMTRLRMDPADYAHFSALDLKYQDRQTFHRLLEIAKSRVPNLRVLWIDGLATLCPGKVNDDSVVGPWLGDIKRICQTEALTVIGVCLATKNRDGEGYSIVRDRLPGAATWSEFTSTKILNDFAKPRDVTCPRRILTVMPQTFEGQRLPYTFDGAFLVPAASFDDNLRDAAFISWLVAQSPSTTFTTPELMRKCDELGIPERSAQRLVKECCDELGLLTKDGRGKYLVPVPS